jgi:hypothetical protein
MTGLFANRADLELNEESPLIPPLDSTEQDSSAGKTARIQTNFKNCIHVFQRSLEELLLLENRMKTVVQRAFDAIVCQHQKVRSGRSYPRRSLKTGSRWRLSKEKREQRKKVLVQAASA